MGLGAVEQENSLPSRKQTSHSIFYSIFRLGLCWESSDLYLHAKRYMLQLNRCNWKQKNRSSLVMFNRYNDLSLDYPFKIHWCLSAFCLCRFKSLTAFTEIPSNCGYWLHFWEGSSEMVTLHKQNATLTCWPLHAVHFKWQSALNAKNSKILSIHIQLWKI